MSRLCHPGRLAFLFGLVLACATPGLAETELVINNVDFAGVGLNDPTPATPVGGNPGTTLGEQRFHVIRFAADLWGSILDSDVEIVVQATFLPLPCSSTAGTLAAAGTVQIVSDFPGVPLDNTWYHVALANHLNGADLTPGPPDPGLFAEPYNDDIAMMVNSDVGLGNCLSGLAFYLGLDHATGGGVDLLNVVMHELAHGLGFGSFVEPGSGALQEGIPDIYTVFTLDTLQNLHWNEMSNAERQASYINTDGVVWNGANVIENAASFLGPGPVVRVTSPAGIAGAYVAQEAQFGPRLTSAGVGGEIETAFDGVGVVADACEPLTNSFQGRIALVERGSCLFTIKVVHAQAAGASAVIVANNLSFGLPPMGGEDSSIGIPAVGVSNADGLLMHDSGPGVQAMVGLDSAVPYGTDGTGAVRLYAPPVVESGSSIVHFDVRLTPNALMEPALTSSIRAGENTDLTPFLLQDLGWALTDGDNDEDGVPNSEDNCRDDANADQADEDDDGAGDVCDNCPDLSNPDQQNSDSDVLGDACDNCDTKDNPGQEDFDLDGLGDACEVGAAGADVDHSGRVDGFDLARLALAFGSGSADPGYDPTVDLDRDDLIDGNDLALLAGAFGQSVQ